MPGVLRASRGAEGHAPGRGTAHGTWFDRAEIASVIAVCGELRRAQEGARLSPREAEYLAVEREGRTPHLLDGLMDLLGSFLANDRPR